MIKKLLTNLNRALMNPTIYLKVLRIWAIASLVIFGFFGVYPQIKALSEGLKTYSEMKNINKLLKEKTDLIRSESLKMEGHQNGIKILDTYLPDDYEVQNYIVDLSFASAKNGYALIGLTVESPTGYSPGVIARANLNGSGGFKELVSTVESLKRISQVDELKFTDEKDEKKVTLLIDIFILE
jgi:Tfp pilus assembly protein PilO